ncbi:MAG TPA: metal ABC transporter permease [Acidimicrobiales bacterium]|nr:metal ABC transporter permease [Acidimicrobiales bacterium]
MSFFASGPVHTALIVGALVAVVSGPVGVFTVIRGQSFAGHALADTGTTGGSGAFLVNVNPLYGFVALNLIAAAVMEALGVRRARGRDVATGIVLGAALGLSALFLDLETRSSTTGATITVLFGSIFTLDPGTVPFVAVTAGVAVAVMAVLYRPLLLSSVSPELAAARGLPAGVVSAGYLLALALAVSLSAVTIGAILSTALLVGPAATALRLTRRPGAAVLAAAGIGTAATWAGVALSYESYYWPPYQQGWPVSFFVVFVVLAAYLAATAATAGRKGRR